MRSWCSSCSRYRAENGTMRTFVDVKCTESDCYTVERESFAATGDLSSRYQPSLSASTFFPRGLPKPYCARDVCKQTSDRFSVRALDFAHDQVPVPEGMIRGAAGSALDVHMPAGSQRAGVQSLPVQTLDSALCYCLFLSTVICICCYAPIM
eukprot:793477-Pleurochrysis_carterae.AAC.1